MTKKKITLGTACVGTPYGHVPGHQYRDVDVVIRLVSGARYRCEAIETWGSAQGHDEEHGRIHVVGRGDTLDDAVRDCEERASQTDMRRDYLSQALGQAAAEAEDAEEAELTANE